MPIKRVRSKPKIKAIAPTNKSHPKDIENNNARAASPDLQGKA